MHSSLKVPREEEEDEFEDLEESFLDNLDIPEDTVRRI